MNSLLKFLKPAPFIKEIEDPARVKSEYQYWRIRILYSAFMGYSFYYLTRKSFTFAMPGMIQDLGFAKSELGFLGSILAISYGMSKFASGVLSDQTNPRYFMALGLMLTGIINICFGMSSSLMMFALFWGLNGWFQGFGWPPCARFLTHWYSRSERGSWWSTFNVSHNVGAFLTPWVAGICLYYFGWRSAMYVPGVLCILGGFFLINRLRDTPQSIGLPAIEKFRNDTAGINENDNDERKLTTRELLGTVLQNPYIWLLAIAYFFVYLVRMGVDWSALFLLETKGYTSLKASGFVSIFEIGGFCGNLCAGWASDRLFGARRGPVIVLFAIGMFLSVIAFWFAPPNFPIFDSAALFCMGFAVFGPQCLIGVAAAELSHKKAAATATGFTGLVAYMGAACAGYPLGLIIDTWGWNGFFYALAGCCVIAVALLVPLWNVGKREPEKTPATKFA